MTTKKALSELGAGDVFTYLGEKHTLYDWLVWRCARSHHDAKLHIYDGDLIVDVECFEEDCSLEYTSEPEHIVLNKLNPGDQFRMLNEDYTVISHERPSGDETLYLTKATCMGMVATVGSFTTVEVISKAPKNTPVPESTMLSANKIREEMEWAIQRVEQYKEQAVNFFMRGMERDGKYAIQHAKDHQIKADIYKKVLNEK